MNIYKNYYSVSIPCSIFISGEHAVLYGKKAIITSISSRIEMILIPHKSKLIKISSDKYGDIIIKNYKNTMRNTHTNINYVIECINLFIKKIKNGFELKINSYENSKIGLGSSGAIVIGVITLLLMMLKKNITLKKIYKLSKIVVSRLQTETSFGDIFASIFGGTYEYTITKPQYKRLYFSNNVELIYCGYKTQTNEVLNLIKKKYNYHKNIFKNMLLFYDKLTYNLSSSIIEKNKTKIGKYFNMANSFLEILGISDNNLNKLYNILISNKNIIGIKITGSGLGDCLICLKKKKNAIKNLDFINKHSFPISTNTSDLGILFFNHTKL